MVEAYGIKERCAASGEAERHAQRIALLGYSVLAGAVPAGELTRLRASIDAGLEQQRAQAGDAEALHRLGEAGTLRACVAWGDEFVQVAAHPRVREVCELVLGSHFQVMLQNAIVIGPGDGHQQSAFHRDLPYQHFTSSRPLVLNALLCVDDFAPASGCTHVLPGSHRQEAFPDDEVVASLETPLAAPAGSFLLFDGMLYHRGGRNSSNAPRRGINTAYSLPFVRQQISLPAVLGGRHSEDPALAGLLGYEEEPPRSLSEWYARRAARARGG